MKKKILFTILTIILVIVVLYIIFYFRNNSILTSVLNIENEYKNKNNLSVEAEVYNENNSSGKIIMKLSHKDNLYKLEHYSDDNNLIFLYNAETKQTQSYDTLTNNMELIENNNFTVQSPMYTLLSDYDKNELIRLALTQWISTEKIDSVSCYRIQTKNRIIWVDKETKLPKKIKFLQSSNNESIILFSNWSVDNLTDNDMELP